MENAAGNMKAGAKAMGKNRQPIQAETSELHI
jgi:hypothetical protein